MQRDCDNPIVRTAAAAKSIELLSIIHLSLETLHYRRDPIDPYIFGLFRSILVNNVLQMESNRPLTFTSDVYYSAGKANRSPDNETHIKANDEGIFKHEHIFCRKNAIFSYFHKCCAFIYLRKILNLHIFEEICHIFIFSRQK